METLARIALVGILFACSAACVVYNHSDEAGYFAMGAVFLLFWGD